MIILQLSFPQQHKLLAYCKTVVTSQVISHNRHGPLKVTNHHRKTIYTVCRKSTCVKYYNYILAK